MSPNDSLLLRLLVEPTGPPVLHQLVLEVICLGHVRDGVLNTPKISGGETSSGDACKQILGADLPLGIRSSEPKQRQEMTYAP